MSPWRQFVPSTWAVVTDCQNYGLSCTIIMRYQSDLPMDGMFPAPKACALPGNSTRMTQKTRNIEVVGPHLRLEEAMMRLACCRRGAGDGARLWMRRIGYDRSVLCYTKEVRITVKCGVQGVCVKKAEADIPSSKVLNGSVC